METNVPEKDVAELDAKHLEEELNKSVGVAVDYKTVTRNNLFKFLIFSAIGVWVFFIPTTIGGNSGVPMVLLIDAVKALLGPTVMNWMVLILCIALSITFTISRIQKDGPIRRFHKKDGWGTGILYYLSAIFAVMVVFNVGPSQIVNDSVGIEAIGLAGSTLLTVTIAGWLVNFLIEFGILEFIGTLMEPIMRKVFKLPGQSAVTAVSAFVAAPAVGVFMTDRLYHENVYTHKEACCVATNFSVVSLGFFALLVTITDTQYMYGKVVISSLVIVFILAAIVIRIPPLSRKKDRYYNGVEQTAAMRKSSKYSKDTMKKAVAASTTKVSQTPYSIFVTSIPGVLSFTVNCAGAGHHRAFHQQLHPLLRLDRYAHGPVSGAVPDARRRGDRARYPGGYRGNRPARDDHRRYEHCSDEYFLCYRAVYRADHLLYGERERNDAERSESEVPGAGPDFPDPYSDRHSDRSGIRPRSVLNGLRKF